MVNLATASEAEAAAGPREGTAAEAEAEGAAVETAAAVAAPGAVAETGPEKPTEEAPEIQAVAEAG